MKERELIIKPHYFVALLIYFIKSLIFIFIIVVGFKVLNLVLGYDIIEIILDTMRMSMENIADTNSPLFRSIVIDYVEHRVIHILLITLLLTFMQQSDTLNKHWHFNNKEFEFREGIWGIKKTTVPLDKIVRVYGVPKADFGNIGHMYIELSMREKKLKLPYVFEIDKMTKEISSISDKYKEKVIEKDIEEDIEEDIKKDLLNARKSKNK